METERLILRDWQPEDVQELIAINQDAKVMEYMPKLLSTEETIGMVERFSNHIKEHGFGPFACIVKETGKCIGWVGLLIPSFEEHFTPCVEIGWRLASQYWGKGYATEAARSVLEAAFNKWNLPEIVSFTVPENIRSRRVMEKLGMHHNSNDDFRFPNRPLNHPLSKHVLYRISKP